MASLGNDLREEGQSVRGPDNLAGASMEGAEITDKLGELRGVINAELVPDNSGDLLGVGHRARAWSMSLR